jgi:hypothetical protein
MCSKQGKTIAIRTSSADADSGTLLPNRNVTLEPARASRISMMMHFFSLIRTQKQEDTDMRKYKTKHAQKKNMREG